MDAADLMIGDLVLYVDKEGEIETPCKILSLNQNGEWSAQILNTEFQFQGDNNECSVEECLLPIPLTSEILEKNGYTCKQSLDKEIRSYNWTSPDRRVTLNDQNGSPWFCIIRSDGMMEEVIIGITYVHELQHALKLCKIKKEIIL